MGSLSPDEDAAGIDVNVLVTGFGPFGNNHINPSFLIASRLPARHDVQNLPAIKIHTHPAPIKVSYETIRETVPNLLFPESSTETSAGSHAFDEQSNHGRQSKPTRLEPQFDIVLHIGMAPGRKFFALETCAHQDGYDTKDVKGETMEGDTLWTEKYRAPSTLRPDFDTEDVWRRWKSGLVNEDIRSSDDAGRYLCDFIYYTSLVEYWRRDPTGARPVMFLHVPGGSFEDDVDRGTRVTLGLIAALVESRSRRR